MTPWLPWILLLASGSWFDVRLISATLVFTPPQSGVPLVRSVFHPQDGKYHPVYTDYPLGQNFPGPGKPPRLGAVGLPLPVEPYLSDEVESQIRQNFPGPAKPSELGAGVLPLPMEPYFPDEVESHFGQKFPEPVNPSRLGAFVLPLPLESYFPEEVESHFRQNFPEPVKPSGLGAFGLPLPLEPYFPNEVESRWDNTYYPSTSVIEVDPYFSAPRPLWNGMGPPRRVDSVYPNFYPKASGNPSSVLFVDPNSAVAEAENVPLLYGYGESGTDRGQNMFPVEPLNQNIHRRKIFQGREMDSSNDFGYTRGVLNTAGRVQGLSSSEVIPQSGNSNSGKDEEIKALDDLLKLYSDNPFNKDQAKASPTGQDFTNTPQGTWDDNDNLLSSRRVYVVGDEDQQDPFTNLGVPQSIPNHGDPVFSVQEGAAQNHRVVYVAYVPVAIVADTGRPVQDRSDPSIPVLKGENPLESNALILDMNGISLTKPPEHSGFGSVNGDNKLFRTDYKSLGNNPNIDEKGTVRTINEGVSRHRSPGRENVPGTGVSSTANRDDVYGKITSVNGIVQSVAPGAGIQLQEKPAIKQQEKTLRPKDDNIPFPSINRQTSVRDKQKHPNNFDVQSKQPRRRFPRPHSHDTKGNSFPKPKHREEFLTTTSSFERHRDRVSGREPHQSFEGPTTPSGVPPTLGKLSPQSDLEFASHNSIVTLGPVGYLLPESEPQLISKESKNAADNSLSDGEIGIELGESYVNDMMDFALGIVDQQLKRKGKDKIAIPDIHKTFSKRVARIQVTGQFDADHGWFKNLSTLQRTADVQLNRVGNTLYVTCSVGLASMQLGYDHYKVTFMHLGPEGHILGTVNKSSITLQVSISISSSNICKITLEQLKVTELSDPEIEVSVLGDLSWLLSQITTWIAAVLKSNVISEVEEKLSSSIREALSRVKCQTGELS